MRQLAIFVLLLSTLASAQIRGRHRLVTTGGGVPSVVHVVSNQTASCNTACSQAITSTTSGNSLVVLVVYTSGTAPSSTATFTATGATFNVPTGCNGSTLVSSTYVRYIAAVAYNVSSGITAVNWNQGDFQPSVVTVAEVQNVKSATDPVDVCAALVAGAYATGDPIAGASLVTTNGTDFLLSRYSSISGGDGSSDTWAYVSPFAQEAGSLYATSGASAALGSVNKSVTGTYSSSVNRAGGSYAGYVANISIALKAGP